ncbi:MAG: adenosine deaminase [Candidatus Acidiferrales bacterium]
MPEFVPDWIARLPKAELHLHLEGSATPETLVALARERGRQLSLAEVTRRYAYGRNFLSFLLAFKWVSEQLCTPADYAFLLRALLERLHRENVLYAEITLSAGVVLWKQQDLEATFLAVRQATEGAQRKHPVEVRWIVDAVRNFGARHVSQVADYALRWKDAGVVAFSIGGEERGAPPETFRATFDRVRAAGLHVTVHAGETVGPRSIWGALRALGAERIGHGLAAFRDPKLVAWLAEQKIPLEVCPSSNLRTGALHKHTGSHDLRRHPLVDYVRRGVPVTLNTDDPGLFETTLNQEYALAHRLGLTREELVRVSQTAFEVAFCGDRARRALLERFRASVISLSA